MKCVISLLALLLSSWTTFAGDNWPQYRGPNGDGISDAKNLVTRWSETENVRWKTAIHDKGWSSPVVWGDQIWMTTARADGKQFFAICVDRRTGKILHDLKLIDEPNPAFCIDYNSYASPTPVIEANRFYFHFGCYGTGCIDTDSGKVLWMRRDLPCNHHRGPGSSPIIWGKLLILLFDGFDQQYVAALDKETGKTIWKKKRDIQYESDNGDIKKAYATASVLEMDGKAQVVCPAAEATIAYDVATGEELWRVRHGGMNEAMRPLFGHGLIYLNSGHTAQLLAVKQGGQGDITKTGIAWKVSRGVPTRPSPLLLGDLIFMVSDNGIATCLEAKTGKQVWQERLGGHFCASPVYAAGNLYLFDEDGKGYVLAAERTFRIVAANQLKTGCMASPAIVGDSLIVRTKTHLNCLRKP